MVKKHVKLEKYYLGIDIGTSSVGWAVTDEEYNIPRLKGKRAWGVRLFEEAKTAEGRRGFRSQMRRGRRRRERRQYLSEIFYDEIQKIDDEFFLRLENSFFVQEDKGFYKTKEKGKPFSDFENLKRNSKNTLFNDVGYDDKAYYKDFPSIWHLRHYLIKDEKLDKVDVRHFYLAILHIIKNRGHFLQKGEIDIDNIKEGFDSLFNKLELECEKYGFYFTNSAKEDLFELLIDAETSKTDKKKKVITIIDEDMMNAQNEETAEQNIKSFKSFLPLLFGSKVSKVHQNIFNIENEDATCDVEYNSNYEDKVTEIMGTVGEENIEILNVGKNIYDFSILYKLLQGKDSLSEAFVEVYNSHEEELQQLKKLFKEHLDEKEYKHFFYEQSVKDDKDITYTSYIKGAKNPKGKRVKHNYVTFLSELKKIIKDKTGFEIKTDTKKISPENPPKNIEDILNKINNEDFLDKARGKFSGTIPYQVHQNELRIILKKLYGKYPGIKKKAIYINDNGDSVDKIESLLTYKIPYYVGPLNPAPEKFGWIEKKDRKKKGKVYPWNFDEIINKEKAAEGFIENLISNCTYLYDKKVLPKNSLLYQKYMTLSDINNIKINGKRIDQSFKEKIFQNVFSEQKTVSRESIKKYLKSNGETINKKDISGTEKFDHTLSSMQDFKKLLGLDLYKKIGEDLIEQCILSITVLPDEPKMLENRLKQILEKSSEFKALALKEKNDLIGKISKLSYSGWGQLSKELLCDIKADVDINNKKENISIIEALEKTTKNLMELMSDKFEFKKHIEDHNKKLGTSISYQKIIDESWASPPVKRSIRQTLKVIDEIKKVAGKEPEKLFLEMPREIRKNQKGKGKRTDSRYKMLDNLYKKIKDENDEVFLSAKQKLGEYENDQTKLSSKALYLYFTQMGKCAYSGNPINIDEINNKQKYDIDHIVPRTFVKDDSFSNLVLVEKGLNAIKTDKYPITAFNGIGGLRQENLWITLKSKGLITKKKFELLMRKDELTDEDKAGFVARQIVETSQSAKLVGDIIKQVYPDIKIIYQKAEVVSDFRREINDYEREKIEVYDHDKDTGEIKTDSDGKLKTKKITEIKKDENGKPVIKKQIKPEFVKCRELNDLHHAKDAYLNIVCGNVYNAKYTNDFYKYVRDNKDVEWHGRDSIKNIFYYDQYSGNKKSGKKVWDIDNKNGLLANVIKTMERNDIIVTRMTYENKSGQNGGFYDQNIVSKVEGKADTFVPLKSKDKRFEKIDNGKPKYGGYRTLSNAYFCLIEYKKKDKILRKIETVPVRYKKEPEEYLKTKFDDSMKMKMIIPKILFKSVVKVNGFPVYLNGASGNLLVSSGTQLLADSDNTKYLKQIIKVYDKLEIKRLLNDKKIADKTIDDIIEEKFNKQQTIQVTKEQNMKLYEFFISKLDDGIFSFRVNVANAKKRIKDNKNAFENLLLCEQITLLLKILPLFQSVPTSASEADLRMIGGGEHEAGTTISKTVDETYKLIYQSPAGFFEKEIDLSTCGK